MYACIDLGGTNIRGTWIDIFGNHGSIQIFSRPRTLEGTKDSLLGLLTNIRAKAPAQLRGIGLASAGPLDHLEKKYLQTSNMRELNYFTVGEFLENAFDLPVLMENDAQAAALGEVWNGCLSGVGEAVVLTLGTGIGSGVIQKGVIWRGGHFTGPELGHNFLGPACKRACGCGQVGCAETWLNKEALIELFQHEGIQVLELKDVFPLLREGDVRALRVISEYGHRLGLYLSIIQVVFGFDYIGLSGGMSHFIPYCLDQVWQTLTHRFVNRKWWLPKRIANSPDPEMSALYGMARAWILAEEAYYTE